MYRSLSDLGNRSENLAGRGQILSILQGNSCSSAQKAAEYGPSRRICSSFSDRLREVSGMFRPSHCRDFRMVTKQLVLRVHWLMISDVMKAGQGEFG